MTTKTVTDQREKAWISSLWMGYIRVVEIDGLEQWAVFDGEGMIVFHSPNRSLAFFFAAENNVGLRMLN